MRNPFLLATLLSVATAVPQTIMSNPTPPTISKQFQAEVLLQTPNILLLDFPTTNKDLLMDEDLDMELSGIAGLIQAEHFARKQANKRATSPPSPFTPGHWWFDSINKKMRTKQFFKGSAAMCGGGFTSTMICNATNMYSAFPDEEICRELRGDKFGDYFAWVPAAAFQGPATVRGVNCNVWTFSTPDKSFNASLCAAGNTPVSLTTQVMSGLPGAKKQPMTQVVDFINITALDKHSDILEVPQNCTEPTPLCHDKPNWQILDTFIAHPSNVYDITNQDTADVVGDVLFTCFDVLSNHTEDDHYSVVSRYAVRVDGRWGEYALCNGYPGICIGNEYVFVGREQPFGCNGVTGQCDSDSETGYWYSFPEAGKCFTNTTTTNTTTNTTTTNTTTNQHTVPADHPCTWSVVARNKTVSIDCLFNERAMRDACRDGVAPFPEAQEVFLKAFESDDPSKGGCPDVPPPPAPPPQPRN